MAQKLSLIMIGAGNMGGSLFASFVEKEVLDGPRCAVIDPNPSDRIIDLCEKGGVPLNPEDDGDGYALCMLGVKPQMFPDILPGLDWPNFADTLFLSIAAGTPIEEIRRLLAERAPGARVVRTMPNLPAAVGQGMTLLTAGPDVTEVDRADTSRLFEAAGEIVWTETEDRLDRLMGISGCGPAYLFLFVEAMEAAALAQGASPEDARKLAETTVTGSAAQLVADGRPADALRTAVTSPGGTTAAGLSVLMEDDRLRDLVVAAAEAAYRRARELAG